MLKHVHMIVIGVVQGVGFRFTTQQIAKKIGVFGWVKNLSNGDVEIEAEGELENVNQFIEIIKSNPGRFIEVDKINITNSQDIVGYSSFEIKH